MQLKTCVKTNLYKKLTGIMRVPFSPQHSKKTMTEEEYTKLISGEVSIEEKLDGQTFLLEIPEEPNLLIFAEYLKYKHTVPYSKVPIPSDNRFLWYVVFDIYDKEEERFINEKEKEEYAEFYEFPISPVLYTGKLLDDIKKSAEFITQLARNTSKFGDSLMEGVVIKNYEKQLFGKYINEEFRIELHWRRKLIEQNQLLTK
jgi:ATP-dependent RNA circularization protein (DNA/RNA ligase family)